MFDNKHYFRDNCIPAKVVSLIYHISLCGELHNSGMLPQDWGSIEMMVRPCSMFTVHCACVNTVTDSAMVDFSSDSEFLNIAQAMALAT